MKAYVLEAVDRLVWKDVEIPPLHAGEVLVEVKAAGICGSDIPRIFTTGTYHFPTIPGHEFSGVVTEVYGSAEQEWLGKRVGVFPLIPCGECPQCSAKQYEMCGHYNYLGSRCDGGFAEYAAVPVWNLIELPEQVSFEEAAMLEPASVALHSVRQLQLQGQHTAALFGLGTIGSIVAQWLSHYGLDKVYATGHWEQFGELMRQTASENYEFVNTADTDGIFWIQERTVERGVDIAIDCVGTSESLEDCLAVVRPGGQILVVANPKDGLQISKDAYWKLLRKQLTLRGTWNSSFIHERQDDWHTVIDACCSKQINLMPLITHKLAFESLKEGLDIMRDKREYRNKVMVVRS